MNNNIENSVEDEIETPELDDAEKRERDLNADNSDSMATTTIISVILPIRAVALLIILGVCELFLWFATRDLTFRTAVDIDQQINEIRLYRNSAQSPHFSPWPVPTDVCTIRIVNPCSSPDPCSRNRLIGYGIFPINSSESGAGIFSVGFKPVNRWPWLFESFENRLWCDVIAVLSPNISVRIFMQENPVTIIAENVLLRELAVQAELASDINNQIWIQAKNMKITERLLVDGAYGGVVIDGLDMPSSGSVSISLTEGSIDIHTLNSPRLAVTSTNKAVCFVGDTAQPAVTATAEVNGEDATRYNTSFACRNLPVDGCSQPQWDILSLGRGGSVGIHAGAPEADAPSVFAGEGFQPAEAGRQTPQTAGRYFFTYADHSSVVNDIYNYALIRLSGLGLMRGGLQAIWAEKAIWFFWGGELTWFATSSLFVVMPRVTEYPATLSFCPARGQPKDLSAPLTQLMDGAHKGDSRGFWAFRNVGGLRDSMQPLRHRDPASGAGSDVNVSPLDGLDLLVPDCDYCSDARFWWAAYYKGSLCENGLPPPHARPAGCRRGSCQRNNAGTFALAGAVTPKCFPDAMVAPLMGVNVTFGAAACVMPADKACEVREGAEATQSVYADPVAEAMVSISISIGALLAALVLYLCRSVYLAAVTKHTIDEMLQHRTTGGNRTFEIIQEAVALSRLFCIARRRSRGRRAKVQPLRRDPELVPGQHPEPRSTEKSKPKSKNSSKSKWIMEDLIRLDKERHYGKYLLNHQKFLDSVPIAFFASARFGTRCSELIRLEKILKKQKVECTSEREGFLSTVSNLLHALL